MIICAVTDLIVSVILFISRINPVLWYLHSTLPHKEKSNGIWSDDRARHSVAPYLPTYWLGNIRSVYYWTLVMYFPKTIFFSLEPISLQVQGTNLPKFPEYYFRTLLNSYVYRLFTKIFFRSKFFSKTSRSWKQWYRWINNEETS